MSDTDRKATLATPQHPERVIGEANVYVVVRRERHHENVVLGAFESLGEAWACAAADWAEPYSNSRQIQIEALRLGYIAGTPKRIHGVQVFDRNPLPMAADGTLLREATDA